MTLAEIKALEEELKRALVAHAMVDSTDPSEPDLDAAVLRVRSTEVATKLSAWPAVVAMLEEARRLLADDIPACDCENSGYPVGGSSHCQGCATIHLLARIDGDLG